MQRLNLTLATAAENVALDEALLDWAEEADAGAADREVLRIWESPKPMVVAGRSTRIEQEINVAECDRRGIPILRRSSGGATIVAGPGCLMYAVVLSLRTRPDLRDITRAHRFVLGRLADALNTIAGDCPNFPAGTIAPMVAEENGTVPLSVACAGTSDLVVTDRDIAPARKFSGNSLRVKRTHFLYHGTLLYNFDLPLIAACLRTPPRQPAYRAARPHLDFLANLPIRRPQLVIAIDAAFPTTAELSDAPLARAEELVATRFGRDRWNREL